jgi:hypothetical protein
LICNRSKMCAVLTHPDEKRSTRARLPPAMSANVRCPIPATGKIFRALRVSSHARHATWSETDEG